METRLPRVQPPETPHLWEAQIAVHHHSASQKPHLRLPGVAVAEQAGGHIRLGLGEGYWLRFTPQIFPRQGRDAERRTQYRGGVHLPADPHRWSPLWKLGHGACYGRDGGQHKQVLHGPVPLPHQADLQELLVQGRHCMHHHQSEMSAVYNQANRALARQNSDPTQMAEAQSSARRRLDVAATVQVKS